MKRVVFHVGAHRAGSTTIQRLLARRGPELAETGVTALLRKDLVRDPLLRQLLSMHRLGVRGIASVWPLHRSKGTTVLVSDENLLGPMPGRGAATLYPHHGSVVRSLRTLGVVFDVGVRWIVRRQDRFLESVYGFRVGRGLTDDFDTFAARYADALHFLPIAKAFLASGIADVRIGLLESLFSTRRETLAWEFLGVGDASWRGRLPRANRGLRGPSLHVMRHLNRHAGLEPAARKRAIAALVQLGGRALPSPKEIAAAFEEAKVPAARSLLEAAVAFAAKERPAWLRPARRRALVARYEAENRELLALPIVRGDPAAWDSKG